MISYRVSYRERKESASYPALITLRPLGDSSQMASTAGYSHSLALGLAPTFMSLITGF